VTTVLAVTAASWGVAMALAPLLQVRAIRAAGHSGSVSVGYQQILLVGFGLWLAYGIALENWALIIPNTIAAVVSLTTILVARRYRSR
jgi:MtN3 and saliva related transmembrane protein